MIALSQAATDGRGSNRSIERKAARKVSCTTSSARAGLFVSWAPFSRRTETLARLFDLDLRFVSTPWPKRPLTIPIKYPWQAVASARLLRGAVYQELWVMDPPSPLVAMAGAAARPRGGHAHLPIVFE